MSHGIPIKPPFFFRFFDERYLSCSVPTREKVIYVTFDDGPVPEVTPSVLEILDRYDAHATFFMVGDNVSKYPDLYQQVIERGHATGNHTFHHLNGWKTAPAAYVMDVDRAGELIQSRFFRPPYGRFTPSQYFLLRKKYHFILWSVLTRDFSRKVTPEECLETAIRYTGPGSVVVFHDSLKAADKMFYALPRFLEHFTTLGYIFSPLTISQFHNFTI